MIVDPTIPVQRAWNTWSDRPAELTFLPLGVKLTPILYSTSQRRATLLPPGADIVFGRHAADGARIEFETRHAGTHLDFRYDRADPYAVRGEWNGRVPGEWGLRYWVTLCLSGAKGEEVVYRDGAAVIRVGTRHVALVTREEAVQVTAHDTVEAVAADYDTNGYFHTATRGTCGRVIALRFNLEMMRSNAFAAAVADCPDLAIRNARAALAAPAGDACLPVQTGMHAGALDAVRDVMAWNTVYDGINHRPYTSVSRIWNLGKFAVWFNDQTYAALMTGLFDTGIARENMAVAMASATPQGNFACIVTSNDAWVDRTQAPNGAFMAWMMYLRTRDRSLLELVYGPLVRNQRWWRTHRDPDGRGLVSCGTSAVGEGLYKGTHFGARNETGMDNSPTHDEAVYDPHTRTLSLLDVGLNCTLALDAEMLALIAAELGHDTEAAEFAALAASGRALIRDELWDETRGIFANRQRDGGFVRSLGPTSFYPLICGAATPEQAHSLLRHLEDPATFGGEYVLPNVTRDDPAFADNVYWRGRIWPNVNYFVWHGLRRYGFDEQASRLAAQSMALFNQSWTTRRISGENYSAIDGEASDQPDTDLFLSWGAMLPMLGVAEVMDFNPWTGWEITITGQDTVLGPVQSPLGALTLVVRDGVMRLMRGARVLLCCDMVGRMTDIVLDKGMFSCRLAPARSGRIILGLPFVLPEKTVAAQVNGHGVAITGDTATGSLIALDDIGAGATVSVHYTPTIAAAIAPGA